ncbi:hypothetical protein Tco_0274211, partial [Tanacetum coccineum]
ASGEKAPKPKYIRKKANSDTSPKKKHVQATKGTKIKSKAKVSKSDKKKQPAKKPTTKGLAVLSEVMELTLSQSDKESWGDSEDEDDTDDDGDNDDDGESNDHDEDSDEIPDPNLTNVDQTELEEEDVDDIVHTPLEYELNDEEKLDDEETMD